MFDVVFTALDGSIVFASSDAPFSTHKHLRVHLYQKLYINRSFKISITSSYRNSSVCTNFVRKQFQLLIYEQHTNQLELIEFAISFAERIFIVCKSESVFAVLDQVLVTIPSDSTLLHLKYYRNIHHFFVYQI